MLANELWFGFWFKIEIHDSCCIANDKCIGNPIMLKRGEEEKYHRILDDLIRWKKSWACEHLMLYITPFAHCFHIHSRHFHLMSLEISLIYRITLNLVCVIRSIIFFHFSFSVFFSTTSIQYDIYGVFMNLTYKVKVLPNSIETTLLWWIDWLEPSIFGGNLKIFSLKKKPAANPFLFLNDLAPNLE